MTVQELLDSIDAGTAIGAEVLQVLAGLDPAIAIPVDIAAKLLPLVEKYVSTALLAWSNASGQPITVANVAALLPNPTPLDKPTS